MSNEIMGPTIATTNTPKERNIRQRSIVFSFLLLVSLFTPLCCVIMLSNSLSMRVNVDKSLKAYSRHIMKGDMSTFPEIESDAPFPRVAWLMSFPNSGTTHTLSVVRKVTGYVSHRYGHYILSFGEYSHNPQSRFHFRNQKGKRQQQITEKRVWEVPMVGDTIFQYKKASIRVLFSRIYRKIFPRVGISLRKHTVVADV